MKLTFYQTQDANKKRRRAVIQTEPQPKPPTMLRLKRKIGYKLDTDLEDNSHKQKKTRDDNVGDVVMGSPDKICMENPDKTLAIVSVV